MTNTISQISLRKTADNPDDKTEKKGVVFKIVMWWLATVPVAAVTSWFITFIEFKV